VDSLVKRRESKKKSDFHQKNIAPATSVPGAFFVIMWSIQAIGSHREAFA